MEGEKVQEPGTSEDEKVKVKRPRTPAAERVLQTASRLFYERGIRAVGVDAIAESASVTKKTLYDNFGSKDELIAAYLRGRDERYRAWLVGVVGRQSGSARERLLATFDALGEWMELENPRGCGFVNAAVELPDPDHPGRAVILEQKRWLRDYLANLATEAGAENPEDLAEKLLILHEGATVANALSTAADAARKSRDIAAVLIESSGG